MLVGSFVTQSHSRASTVAVDLSASVIMTVRENDSSEATVENDTVHVIAMTTWHHMATGKSSTSIMEMPHHVLATGR